MNDTAKLAYNTAEAAAATGLSIDTIRAALRSGDLRDTAVEVNGRKVKNRLILRDDLLAWLRGGSP